MKLLSPALAFAVLAVFPAVAGDESMKKETRNPDVTLGSAGQILAYGYRGGVFKGIGEGQGQAVAELNGKAEPYTVQPLGQEPGIANQKGWRLVFPNAKIEVTFKVTTRPNVVEIEMSEVKELGEVKLKTLAFPNTPLLSLDTTRPEAAIAVVHAEGYNNWRETITPLAAAKPGSDAGNYCFLSDGQTAAGIVNFQIDDCNRVRWQISEKGGVKTLQAQNPVWQYREIDSEILPPARVAVVLTGDENGDGRADWQDAALVCRRILPKPYGSEFVPKMPADQIAMNFGSLAQQPFLRILDEIKTAALLTDGLGHSVLIKGFSAEGHDSANTDCGGHYNERAGGLKDLNFLLEHAKEYNARIGVHINVTEAYPEAHRYNPEILTPNGGWYWLDGSKLIDKRKDLLSGQLFASLDLMRKEMPRLDFVYVDVYGDHGWNAWKLATKLNELKLPIYTEYSTVFDPWSVWGHQRGGFSSQIFRFLWNGERDLCNGDAVLRGGRADDDGFMGWQGAKSLPTFARRTFTRNLPTKYLQNFELLSWKPGQEAIFSDGVKSVRDGNTVTVTRDGRVVMTWTGGGDNSRLFIPWEAKAETKIYAWDDTGAEQAWELPKSWMGRPEVYLYKLTALGRTGEAKLPVAGGKVALKLEKGIPYVLYPQPAPKQAPMAWGDGGLVQDPGFDSRGLEFWKPLPGSQAQVAETEQGNPCLALRSQGGVSQELRGLEAGKAYAASVWVEIKGDAVATLKVLPEGTGAKAASNSVARTDVVNRNVSDSKYGTKFQRLKVIFTMPADGTQAALQLRSEPGKAESVVRFDDVRVVRTEIPAEAAKHDYFEDFENVDQGLGPFVYDCNGQTQTHLSEEHKGFTDDVVAGRYSFKTLNEPAGRVVRTLPSFLRLKANTKYRLQLDTIADADKIYRITAESQAGKRKSVRLELPVPKGNAHLDTTFATGSTDETFLAVNKEKGGGKLVIDNIVVDELGPVPPEEAAKEDNADPSLAGLRLIAEETFAKPLGQDWTVLASKRPGTSVQVENGVLAIAANAHVSAAIERKLPAGVSVVEAEIASGTDRGETWGTGLALLWPDGKTLRINIRTPDHGFGIDWTPSQQNRTGRANIESPITLRLRLEADKVVAEAANDGDEWQALASFPRDQFPGAPDRIRVGKLHGVEGTGDNPAPGAPGRSTVKSLRLYGK